MTKFRPAKVKDVEKSANVPTQFGDMYLPYGDIDPNQTKQLKNLQDSLKIIPSEPIPIKENRKLYSNIGSNDKFRFYITPYSDIPEGYVALEDKVTGTKLLFREELVWDMKPTIKNIRIRPLSWYERKSTPWITRVVAWLARLLGIRKHSRSRAIVKKKYKNK